MSQRLFITVATVAALSVSIGLRDASAAGHRPGFGGAGHLGGAGSAWYRGPSSWHAGSAWHGGKDFSGRRWRNVGWGFYDPFIGYPFFGYPYAESPNVLQCLRSVRMETLYGVSWQRVWVCN